MIKLTQTQRIVLSSARQRDDGLATRPANLRASAVAKLIASLCEKGFAKEVRAKPDAPVWREDENGRFTLKVLKAGRIAAETQTEAETDVQDETPTVTQPLVLVDAQPQRDGAALAARSAGRKGCPMETLPIAQPALAAATNGNDSKRSRVIALLQRPDGASMADLIAATGWLPHTTRAALSGLRKRDLALERFRDAGLTTRYRIIDASNVSAVTRVASSPVSDHVGAAASNMGASARATA